MTQQRSLRSFTILHTLAVVLHTSCFAYVVTKPHGRYPFTMQIETFDYTHLDDAQPYYRPLEEMQVTAFSVYSLQAFVAITTAVFHSLVYLPIVCTCSEVVWFERKALAVRWVEYALTSTALALSSTLKSGVASVHFVVALVCSSVVLQALGFCIEQLKHLWPTFLCMGVLLQIGTAWPVVWTTLTGTTDASQWIETAAFLFYYSLFAINCISDARGRAFVSTDWTYNVLSLTSKLALFWLQVGDLERTTSTDVLWPTVATIALGIVAPFVGLVLLMTIFHPLSYDTPISRPPTAPMAHLWYRLATIGF